MQTDRPMGWQMTRLRYPRSNWCILKPVLKLIQTSIYSLSSQSLNDHFTSLFNPQTPANKSINQ